MSTEAGSLRCVECGAIADVEARGWRAFIAHNPDEDELPEIAVYCPDCAEREFGE